MKKVLLALIFVAAIAGLLGTRLFAADATHGDLVVHFKAWNEDYTDLGSWAWGDTAAGKRADGTDDFGAYWNYNNIVVGTEVGFIAVYWVGDGPNWDAKLTGDVNLGAEVIVADTTTHVYVFQGASGAQYTLASPDHRNLLVVYYDPSGSYEETLGLHHWGWTAAGPAWASPDPILVTVGKSVAGFDVKAVMMYAVEDWAGLLIYAGDDATKKTGDVTLAGGGADANGEVGFAYVVSKGDAYTANDNVYYNDYEGFADAAFSFKLMSFDVDSMSGTYAVDPNTIIVKTSAQVPSPYPTATDKDAAKATIESWFTVREITGVDTYGAPLDIERVDFATSNSTLNAFVVILEDELDNTKNYEVFFNLNHPDEALAVEKEVAVTLSLTVPANTPVDAVMSAAGAFQGWTPGAVGYVATRVGTTSVYTLTFNVSVIEAYTTFEYKWTRGSWDNDEYISSNRQLVIPNNVDTITFTDVVEAWKDINPPAEQYAPPVRVAELNLKASLEVAMDTEAPVVTFISPTGIVGKVAAERIIEVTWGQPFNQNSFPRFRAADDRDGDLTPFVYVPKGANSVLNTRIEGDYTIMLRVVDKWGNVTEETFIFRVVKPA